MLDVLGLTADQAALYGVLVARPSASVDELSAQTGATAQRTSALLAGLEGKGLVARQGAASSRYAASPPAVAVGALILEQREALRRAELALETLNQTYRDASAGRGVGDAVDVVLGSRAVRQRFAQLQDGARAEVRAFVRSSSGWPRPAAAGSEPWRAEGPSGPTSRTARRRRHRLVRPTLPRRAWLFATHLGEHSLWSA